MRTFTLLASLLGLGCGVGVTAQVEVSPQVEAAPSSDASRALQPPRFLKVSNAGLALPPTAQLGPGPNDWACTWDATTGLSWEMKTVDGGLHDAAQTFSWFEPGSGAANIGWRGPPGCSGTCDTQSHRASVNQRGLCGASDWRLPHRAELEGLVVCAAGRDRADDAWVRGFPCADYRSNVEPRLEQAFFPNVPTAQVNSGAYFFWSDEGYEPLPEYAFYVNFRTGGTDRVFKSERRGVRLVRAAPRPSAGTMAPPTALTLAWDGGGTAPRQLSLSGPRHVSLVVTGHTSAPSWRYRVAGATRLDTVACDPSADSARCAFEVPGWAQPGRYELLVEARDASSAIVLSNALLAELVP